jgi:hypothetical protein
MFNECMQKGHKHYAGQEAAVVAKKKREARQAAKRRRLEAEEATRRGHSSRKQLKKCSWQLKLPKKPRTNKDVWQRLRRASARSVSTTSRQN